MNKILFIFFPFFKAMAFRSKRTLSRGQPGKPSPSLCSVRVLAEAADPLGVAALYSKPLWYDLLSQCPQIRTGNFRDTFFQIPKNLNLYI